MNKVQLEIAGPAAMFARPDTGSTPTSYPVPTFSASKGIFEAVLRRPQIHVEPTKVEVCRPVRFESYVTNYCGPASPSSNFQHKASILVDVCFRVYADIKSKLCSTLKNGKRVYRERKTDWAPRFVKLFNERLNSGQCFYMPCLGWSEFTPTYVGPFRDKDEFGVPITPDGNVNLLIPSMLYSMWENKRVKPRFVQNAAIIDGCLIYEKPKRRGDEHAE